ncbi:hypothetical protein DRP04_15385 [Archaeoglobales archaeon]|nr:MAG: hypothetical protein DRP04_15385 [Archaeoglobales archaeon]
MVLPKLAQVQVGEEYVSILNVPFMPQPPQMLCFPYTVKMIVEFYRNTEQPATSQQIPALEIEQIIRTLNADPERGTILSKSIIKKLNELTNPIEFEMGKGNLEKLDKCYEKKNPPILIFDPMYYLYSRSGGAAHATVYLGRTDTKIVVNNPWMGKNYLYDLEKFIESWEIEDFRMVTSELKVKIQPTKLNNFFEILESEG